MRTSQHLISKCPWGYKVQRAQHRDWLIVILSCNGYQACFWRPDTTGGLALQPLESSKGLLSLVTLVYLLQQVRPTQMSC